MKFHVLYCMFDHNELSRNITFALYLGITAFIVALYLLCFTEFFYAYGCFFKTT